jgi:hypothetical protein
MNLRDTYLGKGIVQLSDDTLIMWLVWPFVGMRHSRDHDVCLRRAIVPVNKTRMHVQHDESISLSRSFVACAIHVAMVRLPLLHKTRVFSV